MKSLSKQYHLTYTHKYISRRIIVIHKFLLSCISVSNIPRRTNSFGWKLISSDSDAVLHTSEDFSVSPSILYLA